MASVSEFLCQYPHKRPTATVEGSTLCSGCVRRFRESLPEVARLWIASQELSGVMSSQKGEGGRRGPSSKPPSDIDLIAMEDMRTEYTPGSDIVPVNRWIVEIDQRVALERGFGPGKTILESLGGINRNIDYISTREYGPDVVSKFGLMQTALRRQCGEVRHAVGTCQAPTETGDDCGGTLRQDRDGSATVRCNRCREVWSDGGVVEAWGQLRRLGAILDNGEINDYEEGL